VFKILLVLQFVVSHLEITHCSSESLKSKASCTWTEQRWNRKFVLGVVIWVSSIVRPPKLACVKAAILFQGGNFRDHRYGNVLIYGVYRYNVLSLIHMSVLVLECVDQHCITSQKQWNDSYLNVSWMGNMVHHKASLKMFTQIWRYGKPVIYL
jgi:hypothetical protein